MGRDHRRTGVCNFDHIDVDCLFLLQDCNVAETQRRVSDSYSCWFLDGSGVLGNILRDCIWRNCMVRSGSDSLCLLSEKQYRETFGRGVHVLESDSLNKDSFTVVFHLHSVGA